MAASPCVVCGTDLSEGARPALEAAAALASSSGAELWVVHAVERRDDGGRAQAAAGEREASLAEWSRDVGSRYGISQIRQAVLAGVTPA